MDHEDARSTNVDAIREPLERLARMTTVLRHDNPDSYVEAWLEDQRDAATRHVLLALIEQFAGDDDHWAVAQREKIDGLTADPPPREARNSLAATALTLGVSVLVGTGAAPLAALAVGDVVWKETIKAVITTTTAAVATLATQMITEPVRTAPELPSAATEPLDVKPRTPKEQLSDLIIDNQPRRKPVDFSALRDELLIDVPAEPTPPDDLEDKRPGIDRT